MWTREALKRRAKLSLSKYYWSAFVVSLIVSVMGSRGGGFNFNYSSGDMRDFKEIWPYVIVIGIFVLLITVSLRVFAGYHLEVGGRRYFIRLTHDESDMNALGYGFKKGRYVNIIWAMLWRGLLVFLWSLLLIIPGIIKAYAYRMVPYILADNPELDYKRAVKLSDHMTHGHKLNLWVLDLSFIGWYLLGVMACCIGVIFVFPYQDATEAELYIVLRENALKQGLCSYGELRMTPPSIEA